MMHGQKNIKCAVGVRVLSVLKVCGAFIFYIFLLALGLLDSKHEGITNLQIVEHYKPKNTAQHLSAIYARFKLKNLA